MFDDELMIKYGHLVGKKFNRLTVLRFYRDQNSRVLMCTFLCDCGNTKDIYYYSVTKGATKSCGCLNREVIERRMDERDLDLVGKRFGRLLVKKRIRTNGATRSSLWLCECDCGNLVEVKRNGMVSGYNKSCGCLEKENREKVQRNVGMEDSTIYSTLNRKVQKNNKSGVRGVCFDSRSNRWIASICFKKNRKILGKFKTKEEAIEVRRNAEDELWGSVQNYIEAYNERVRSKKIKL